MSEVMETRQPVKDAGARTLIRGLRLLELVASAGSGLGVTEAAAQAGLDKGTTSRLLRTLRELGYVRQRSTDSKYVLGTQVLLLSRGFHMSLDDLRITARPELEALGELAEETVHFAVRDGSALRYLDVLEPRRRPSRVDATLGRSYDLRETAMGRAILAQLDFLEREDILAELGETPASNGAILSDLANEIERGSTDGWATVSRGDGVVRVASAIIGGDGQPIAAVSLSGPEHRVPDPDALGRMCVATAQSISHLLGARGV